MKIQVSRLLMLMGTVFSFVQPVWSMERAEEEQHGGQNLPRSSKENKNLPNQPGLDDVFPELQLIILQHAISEEGKPALEAFAKWRLLDRKRYGQTNHAMTIQAGLQQSESHYHFDDWKDLATKEGQKQVLDMFKTLNHLKALRANKKISLQEQHEKIMQLVENSAANPALSESRIIPYYYYTHRE